MNCLFLNDKVMPFKFCVQWTKLHAILSIRYSLFVILFVVSFIRYFEMFNLKMLHKMNIAWEMRCITFHWIELNHTQAGENWVHQERCWINCIDVDLRHHYKFTGATREKSRWSKVELGERSVKRLRTHSKNVTVVILLPGPFHAKSIRVVRAIVNAVPNGEYSKRTHRAKCRNPDVHFHIQKLKLNILSQRALFKVKRSTKCSEIWKNDIIAFEWYFVCLFYISSPKDKMYSAFFSFPLAIYIMYFLFAFGCYLPVSK